MEPSRQGGVEDDRALLARLAVGDQDALAPFMARHHQRIYRLCLSYLRSPDDALDAVQETFVKAYEKAGRVSADHDPGRWLSRIAINQSIDLYRRRRSRGRLFEALEERDHDRRLGDDQPSAERRVLGSQIGSRIDLALRTLPERQRAVFVLRHYEGLSLEEIARDLGISLGTVKSSLHRALHHLRERLQGLRA